VYLQLQGSHGGISSLRDGVALCAFAAAAAVVAHVLRKRGHGQAGAAVVAACVLALSAAALAASASTATAALPAVGAAGVLVILARVSGSRAVGALAGLAVNLALLPVWRDADVDSPAAVAAPLGATLAVLARIYRDRLTGLPVVRSAAVLLTLGSIAIEALRFDDLFPQILVAVLAVAAVVLGLLWRVRSYLFAGFLFAAGDIVVNLTRFGLRDRLLAGALAVGAGVVLFTCGVLVARHKERFVARAKEHARRAG
jgi:hypothetical protein